MKKLFRSALIGAAALAALAAGPTHAAKDVVFAVASTFTTTDPYDANDTLSQAMAKSFYQGLYGFDKDMKMIPVLAESHEVSKDGLVYTFKLRKGVKFHDGTDFKADAVKANFDRVTNPDNKLKRYSLYNNIAKTEVVDDYTARITLKTPFSAFINQLAHPSGVMISPTALKKYGKDIAFNPVGTGPFKFVEWKQTDYLKVAKFDGYWKKGLPKVDTITWKSVDRQQLAQRGDADRRGALHVPGPLRAGRHAEGQGRPRGRRRAVDRPPLHVDERAAEAVRQPQGAAGDQLRDQQGGAGQGRVQRLRVPGRGCHATGVEYHVKTGPWPYDVAKAKALLAEAGYPNGFETELWSAYNHSTAQKVIQFLQQQLAQVGIKAKIQALEAGTRVEKVESWQDPATAPVRLYYVGWSSSTGEADWALRPLLASESRRRRASSIPPTTRTRRSTPRSRARSSPPTRPRRRSSTRRRRRRSGRTRPGPSSSPSGCCRSTTRSSRAST